MDGDIVRNIRDNFQWIAHFHTGGNPGRHDIDESQELNYHFIAQAIADLNYTGFISHEYSPAQGHDPIATLNKAIDYFDLFFVDHHFFRAVYANRHQIAPGVWRSAQPGPAQIASFARKGIKTIVNLRGERDCGSYRLEVEACQRNGIKLVNFQLRSRMVPTVEVIHEARALFNELEYPILLHCKSGADRAGLTPSDMVERKLLYLLRGASVAGSHIHAASPRPRGRVPS